MSYGDWAQWRRRVREAHFFEYDVDESEGSALLDVWEAELMEHLSGISLAPVKFAEGSEMARAVAERRAG